MKEHGYDVDADEVVPTIVEPTPQYLRALMYRWGSKCTEDGSVPLQTERARAVRESKTA